MSAKHTSGPWKADIEGPFTLGGDTIAVEAVTADGREVRREICTLLIDTEENDDTPEAEEDKANACLIAAAPDLLAAAGQALGALSNDGCDHSPRCGCGRCKAIDLLEAAIAKAERQD